MPGDIDVPQMRLTTGAAAGGGHEGEVLACAFTPDGALVLSGGWDGCLRLWEVTTGAPVSTLPAAPKPITACAVSPDGRQWWSGSMDGHLVCWAPVTHRPLSHVLAHTRPISAIVFSPDETALATASWDRSARVRRLADERGGCSFTGHLDIISGCCFTPDGSQLVTWSHDATFRTWDVATGNSLAVFTGHRDRITVGAVSPDGVWAATGSRDRSVVLWNLPAGRAEGLLDLGAEARACAFLPDGSSLLCADAHGRLTLHSVPDREPLAERVTRLPVQCAALSPLGTTLALGCADGRVHMVQLDGAEDRPLVVTPTETIRLRRSAWGRLLGRPQFVNSYSCTCPACRHAVELPDGQPGTSAVCPGCQRSLRLGRLKRARQET